MAVVQRRRQATGRRPPVVRGPELPAEAAFLWACYRELDDSRDCSMGMAPITEASLFFYGVNRGFRFEPWEIETLRSLDAAHRSHNAEQQKQKGG